VSIKLTKGEYKDLQRIQTCIYLSKKYEKKKRIMVVITHKKNFDAIGNLFLRIFCKIFF
jgi:hypothetical protein